MPSIQPNRNRKPRTHIREQRHESRERGGLTLENLEPRILLSTLEIGQTGLGGTPVYYDSLHFVDYSSDNVVITLGSYDSTNPTPATIEVIGRRFFDQLGIFDVTDVPGIQRRSDGFFDDEVGGGLAGESFEWAQPVGFLSAAQMQALAIDGSGTAYGVHNDNSMLATVNLATGASSNVGVVMTTNPFDDPAVVGDEQIRVEDVRAADFDSTDTLYIVGSINRNAPDNPDGEDYRPYLFIVNLGTQFATRIDVTATPPGEGIVVQTDVVPTIDSIAFNAGNALYGVDTVSGSLIQINSATGSVIRANTIEDEDGAAIPIMGIDFVSVAQGQFPAGTLIGLGSDDNGYTINPGSGRATLVAALGRTFPVGAAFDPVTADFFLTGRDRPEGEIDGNYLFVLDLEKDVPIEMDIFAIYVIGGGRDTYISVSTVEVDDDLVPETDTPLGGSQHPILDMNEARIRFSEAEDHVSLPGDTGGVFIGGYDTDNGADPAILGKQIYNTSIPVSSALGLWPGGFLDDGIHFRQTGGAPVLFGNVLVAGAIVGTINLPFGGGTDGSMNTLYAGWLGTELIDVRGDLNNLAVNTQAGMIDDNDWVHSTNTLINVEGELSHVQIKSHTEVAFQVKGKSTAASWRDVVPFDDLYEIEDRVDTEAFKRYFTLGGFLHDLVTNDTAATSQFLVSPIGDYKVVGKIENFDPINETSDFYSIASLAGQTFAVDLRLPPPFHADKPGDLAVNVFDPDGEVVVQWGYLTDPGASFPKAVEFTAEKAGIYRLEVTAIRGGVDSIEETEGLLSYELRISNHSPTTFGGGWTAGDLHEPFIGPSVVVQSGNFGGFDAQAQVGVGPDNEEQVPSFVNYDIQQGSLFAFQGLAVDEFTASTGEHIGLLAGLGPAPNGESDLRATAGGDIQHLYVNDDWSTFLHADGNIGHVEVTGDLNEDDASDRVIGLDPDDPEIMANVDQSGLPGIIDFIDVEGNFGPARVSTGGFGGNVRYARVEGSVYVDAGLAILRILEAPGAGKPIELTDDSGAELTFKATGGLDTSVSPAVNTGELTAEYIPIEGIGGQTVGAAITRITSNVGISVSANVGNSGATMPTEIGEIILTGSTAEDTVSIKGRDPISVGTLEAPALNRVKNTTPDGDIVNAVLTSVNNITVDGNLGIARNTTGQGLFWPELSNVVPMGSQEIGLLITSDVETISAGDAIGFANITGNVGKLIANEDNSRIPNTFEGINGVVLITGDVDKVELGDGVPDAGTGVNATHGLYATGHSKQVSMSGQERYISGPVYFSGGIDKVTLSDGASLLGIGGIFGRINKVPNLAATSDFEEFRVTHNVFASSGDLGKITLKGENARIENSEIHAINIDSITISRGEGIFDSHIRTLANGVIGSITTDGQGIQDSEIQAGRLLEKINVKKGSLTDSWILAIQEIGSVKAPLIENTEFIAPDNIQKIQSKSDMIVCSLSTGGLGTLKVAGDLDGLSGEVAGTVKLISTKGDFISDMSVLGPAGDLKKVTVGGDFGTPVAGEVFVQGTVGTFKVKGNFEGNLTIVSNSPALKNLDVKGNLNGNLDIGGDVGKMSSGGTFGLPGQTMSVGGDLDKLTVGKGKGSADLQLDSLTINGEAGTLKVNGNFQSDLTVDGNCKTVFVSGGDLNGDVAVFGDLKLVKIIGGDMNGAFTAAQPDRIIIKGSDINNEINVDALGDLRIDGNLTRDMTVTTNVNRLYIGGDILAGPDDDNGIVEIDVGGYVKEIYVRGDVTARIRIGNYLGEARIDGHMIDTTLAVAGDVNRFELGGDMNNSKVLAGFDPGADMIPTAGDTALQGDLRWAFIGGDFRSSVLGAGVAPGSNDTFCDGNDVVGFGLSSMDRVEIAGTIVDDLAIPFGIEADTAIERLRIGNAEMTPPYTSGNFSIFTIDYAEAPVINGIAFRKGDPVYLTDTSGTLIKVSLSGLGVGELTTLLPGETDPGIETTAIAQIHTISLNNTTDKSKLKITARRGDRWIDVGNVFTGDDDSLKQFILPGALDLTTGNPIVAIDGSVDKFSVKAVGSGAAVTIGGGVEKMQTGPVEATAGATTSLQSLAHINTLATDDIDANVFIYADYFGKVRVKGELAGTLRAERGGFNSVIIDDDLSGLLSAQTDLNKTSVRGTVSGKIRAGENIEKLSAGELYTALIGAGRDFDKLTVKGDVTYTTVVAGIDLGPNVAFDPHAVGNFFHQATLDKTTIKGDMTASNLSADVHPGPDGWFGTADDIVPGGLAGRINKVTVKGDLVGTADPNDLFAIIASDRVGRVVANGVPRFGTVANNVFIGTMENTFEATGIEDIRFPDLNTIEIEFTDPMQADTLTNTSVQVIPQFGPGAGTPLTPTTLTWDLDNNTLVFYRVDGLDINFAEPDYYTIRIATDQTLDRGGEQLDADYLGAFPTGNGVPGTTGDLFEYTFAVGDFWNTLTEAYPLDLFENVVYTTQGVIGDDPLEPVELDLDADRFQFEAKENQVLIVYVETMGMSNLSPGLTVYDDTGGFLDSAGRFLNGFVIPDDGTYFVDVGSNRSGSNGAYEVQFVLVDDGSQNFDDTIQLTLIEGQPGTQTINADIAATTDLDVYETDLRAGQTLILDLDGVLQGSDFSFNIGVFDSNEMLVAAWGADPDDVLPLSEQVDPNYSVQVPSDDTYYIVVQAPGATYQNAPYTLNVGTTIANPIIPPDPQVVYLAFNGGVVPHVAEFFPGFSGVLPAFDAAYFDLAGQEQAIIDRTIEVMVDVYDDIAGLNVWAGANVADAPANADLIFVTTKPPLYTEFSTVTFGGDAPGTGLYGIASDIDRGNENHTDFAAVFTDQIGSYERASGVIFDIDKAGRELANIGAHELGHILGLHHHGSSTQELLMDYGDFTIPRVFGTGSLPDFSAGAEFQIGNQNAVDMLLRNLVG